MSPSSSASLSLRNVSLSYGSTSVIRSLSMDVEAGEMLGLLGASGCGKTTILKLVAGLLKPDHGEVLIDGVNVISVPAEKRRTAMVFQKPLLFPYMTVAENVGFSLRLKNTPKGEIDERVREALALVRLSGYETRRPSQLSGGQEQRVSLARALVSDPRILLLDEPFAALDENLRSEIRTLVRSIQRKLQLTAVFVTHDRNEAAVMAHRIAWVDRGEIPQVGTLREFYEVPASVETARFFGWQLLQGDIDTGYLTTGVGKVVCSDAPGPVWVAFRPEAATMETGVEGNAAVETSVDLGVMISTVVRLENGETTEVIHPPPQVESGQQVRVGVRGDALRVFRRFE